MHIEATKLGQTVAQAKYSYAFQSRTVKISQGRRSSAPAPQVAASNAAEATLKRIADAKEEFKLKLLRKLFEAFTGKALPEGSSLSEFFAAREAVSLPNARGQSGITVEETVESEVGEAEKMSYSATGKVLTADGKEIEIDVSVRMSREFYSKTTLRYVNGQELKDPLVVNFDGPAAALEGEKVAFDLDSDGREEKVARLGRGSGYLALDKNSNGQVDSGSELFGPATGKGFSELSRYDDDGNGWIDEADPVFSKLKVWTFNENGERGELLALASVGLGAISVRGIKSPFDLKDQSTNQLLGQVKATGVFLREDGTAGTVQELDLAV